MTDPSPSSLPRKVLIANRGEIAIRIARSCQEAGISTVGIYSEADRDSLHAGLMDEAFALRGSTPLETYLDIPQIIAIGRRAGVDSVHPGYGFLAESAELAEAVLNEGMTWIGPPPSAIRALGDKVSARHIATKVGAPLAAGTPEPVSGIGEVEAFVAEHGLPIAVKAAFGGGGRGLKVVRHASEIRSSYDAAVREATAAFGRGECFVEKYLDRPRHVETQCLADTHGNVAVLSTRDCTLQRRHQKLVEEAPAPDLTPEQVRQLVASSEAILKEVGYVGAATCEFLISGDTVAFLEVNTRIQVEHPVTEEVTGVDLIHEMLRIAGGGRLPESYPAPRGHSFEFRINAENVSANFAPSPGTITRMQWPQGPGIRVDAGFTQGSTVPPLYDSLIAKLIVTAADRPTALRRAQRALNETVIDGIPTTLDFHRQVVHEAILSAASPYLAHTRWIDTDFVYSGPPTEPVQATGGPTETETITVEVDGRRLSVRMPAGQHRALPPTTEGQRSSRKRRPSELKPADDSGVKAPMSGTVVAVKAEEGESVERGQPLVVLEAMKMEQTIEAPYSGTLRKLNVQPGVALAAGDVICLVDKAAS